MDNPQPATLQSASAPPILIGLSYSLDADGSPGYYNNVIGSLMEADYGTLTRKDPHNPPWLGMQWEIWDALDGRDLQKMVPQEQVVRPPVFSKDDVPIPIAKDLDRLLRWLNAPASAPEDIATALNRVLEDPNFAKKFRNLQLPVLQRGGHRFVWVEERRIPGQFPLKRFQAWRVNRFIIERLCPVGVKAGIYLGARKVFRTLFEKAPGPIGEVWIYAHPEHFPACRDDAASAAGELKVGIGRIVDRTTDQWGERLWDEHTAQHWCRSFDRWRMYQADMRAYYEGAEP